MTAPFDLVRNPFIVLRAGLHATAEDIVNLRHEAVFRGRIEEAAADEAQ